MNAWLGRILLRTVRLAAYASLAVILAFLLLLAACQPIVVRSVLPSPDRNVALVIETQLAGGAAGSIDNQAMLVGRGFDQKIDLGYYGHGWPGIASGWIDDRTVNVCPLRGNPKSPRRAVLIGWDGREREYRILNVCPPGVWSGEDSDRPIGGYDYDKADQTNWQ